MVTISINFIFNLRPTSIEPKLPFTHLVLWRDVNQRFKYPAWVLVLDFQLSCLSISSLRFLYQWMEPTFDWIYLRYDFHSRQLWSSLNSTKVFWRFLHHRYHSTTSSFVSRVTLEDTTEFAYVVVCSVYLFIILLTCSITVYIIFEMHKRKIYISDNCSLDLLLDVPSQIVLVLRLLFIRDGGVRQGDILSIVSIRAFAFGHLASKHVDHDTHFGGGGLPVSGYQ